MTTSSMTDRALEQIEAGRALDAATVRDLAGSPDILAAGMLADALRRRLHGAATTYVRVHTVEAAETDAPIPEGAGELRLAGTPATLAEATARIVTARTRAGGRPVSGFAWSDVVRLAGAGPVADVLAALRASGLDALAEVAIDGVPSVDAVVDALAAAGFTRVRLHVAASAPTTERLVTWDAVARAQTRTGAVASVNPLPQTLSAFKPTTGYDDVKAVALARLALPGVPHIQVDWLRYGPKLAQVALTFGADDVDGVSASDDAPHGRRRAPLEEIRRNIEAAGFRPQERTGAFEAVPGI